jgi:hypothetical protein
VSTTLADLIVQVQSALEGVCETAGFRRMLMPLSDDEGAALADTGYQLKPGPLKPAQIQAASTVFDFDQVVSVVLIAIYQPEDWYAAQWGMCGEPANLCDEILALKARAGALFDYTDITRITIGAVESEEKTYGQFRITIPVTIRYRKPT